MSNVCLCGCNNFLEPFDKYGRPRKYIRGHNTPKGNLNQSWKGGRIQIKGYWYIRKPDHPFANIDRPYIPEHHSVYEHYLYILFDEHIYIPKGIDIHHENENTLDNSLINLTPLEHGEHSKITNTKDMSDRYCLLCYKTKSSNNNWYKYLKGFICKVCYNYNLKKELSN